MSRSNTPDFALSLSSDGVRLLHRSDDEWSLVGEASPTSANLASDLGALRAKAKKLAPGALRTRLILPNDQIKFITLPQADANEAAVRAAIEGATPYTLDELVVDHVSRNGKTYIAAVARETLEEAEAFATEFKFAAVAFAAAPQDDVFAGEAFFGATKAAESLLSKGQTVAREPRSVMVRAATVPNKDTPDASPKQGNTPTEKPAKTTEAGGVPADVNVEKAAEATPKEDVSKPADSDEKAVDAGDTKGAKDAATDAKIEKTAETVQPPAESPVAPAADDAAFQADDPASDVADQDTAPGADAEARPAVIDTSDAASKADEDAGDDTGDEDTGLTHSKTVDAPNADDGPNAEDVAPEITDDGPLFSSRLRTQLEKATPTDAAKPDAAPPLFAAETQTPSPDSGLSMDRTDAGTLTTPAPSQTERPESRDAPPPSTPTFGRQMPPPARPLSDASGPQPVPPRLASGTPPPAVAERLAAIAGRDLRGSASPLATSAKMPLAAPVERPSMAPPPPPLLAASQRQAIPSASAAPIVHDAMSGSDGAAPPGKVLTPSASLGAPPAGLAATLRQDVRAAPPSKADVSAPAVPTAAPADRKSGGLVGGLFSSRRKSASRSEPTVAKSVNPKSAPNGAVDAAAAAANSTPTSPAPQAEAGPAKGRNKALGKAPDIEGPSNSRALAQSSKSPQTERDSMTVFGARRRQSETGRNKRPRFLLFILLIVLLGAMAAIAAWAAAFPDSRVAAWLWLSDPPAAVASVDGQVPPSADVIAAVPGTDPAADPGGNLPLTDAAEVSEPETTATDPVDTATVAALAPSDTPPVAPGNEAALTVPGTDGAPNAPAVVADGAVSVILPSATALPEFGGPEVALAAQTDPSPPAPAEAAAEETAVVPQITAPTPNGIIPTPAEADRFYAATGVWLRAPRLPLRPESQSLTNIFAAPNAAPTAARTPSALPALAPDGAIAAQRNPPAADVEFPRDDRGFLLATSAGIVTPDGMVIYARAPDIVPPTRPGTAPPAPVVTEAVDPSGFVNALPVAPARPTLRPATFADLFGPVPSAEAPDRTLDIPPTDDDTVLPEDVTAPVDGIVAPANDGLLGGISLAGLRPPVRPEGLTPSDPAPEVLVSFAGPRPPERPDGLGLPPEEVAEDDIPPEDVTSIENTVTSALAAIVPAGPDPLANATAQAVAIAPRPGTRPRNFSTVVTNTLARTQAAAAVPAAAAPAAAATTAPAAAVTQPEAVSAAAAAPTGPSNSTVAAAATQQSVIDLHSVNLIGVYGRPNARRALIRLSNGRYVRVGIGDALEGGQVTAIGDNALNYVVRGQLYALVIPEE